MVDTHNGARPQLKYLSGDTCTADPKNMFASLIEFYCDPKAGKVSKHFRLDRHLALWLLLPILKLAHKLARILYAERFASVALNLSQCKLLHSDCQRSYDTVLSSGKPTVYRLFYFFLFIFSNKGRPNSARNRRWL